MKLLAILHGFVGFKEAIEEYQPAELTHPQDIIDLVRDTYKFTQFPILHPGQPLPSSYNFSAGRFTNETSNFSIGQLVMSTNGDVVLTISTEQSEMVLNNLITLLDEKFGYRLRQSSIKKRYLTNLVVEFDRALEEYFHKIALMGNFITGLDIRDRKEFKLKQISFGDSPEIMLGTADPFELMEKSDFVIQRRAGQEFEKNRYYCSAPLPDKLFVEALQQIEAIAAG